MLGSADRLDVDEDALAGAGQGGVDDGLLVACGDFGQALTAARIVEHVPALDYVGDPILQLGKDVGAMVNTKPVARAQVLVDPYPHVGSDATAQTRPATTCQGRELTLTDVDMKNSATWAFS